MHSVLIKLFVYRVLCAFVKVEPEKSSKWQEFLPSPFLTLLNPVSDDSPQSASNSSSQLINKTYVNKILKKSLAKIPLVFQVRKLLKLGFKLFVQCF